MSGVAKFVAGVVLMVVGFYTKNPKLIAMGARLAFLGALEEVSKLFVPSPPKNRYRSTIEYSGTVTPRKILFGKLRVGGLNTVRPIVTGDGGKYLHQIVTVAGHPCNAIPVVYFHEAGILSSSITAVSGTADDGKVTVGAYTNKAWVRRYLGSDSQTVDYKLNQALSSLWTSNHRGRGVTYMALTFELDEKIYATGKPLVACLAEGWKCYDPRLDTSPGANPTNAAYEVYTTNPALQLAKYLLDTNLGCSIPAARIDWTLCVAAANVCDELVAIPGSTTQKRYESSVMLEAAGTRREDNIKALAGAMMGTCYRQGGKYRMYAGAALSPSFALTEANIVGDVSVRTETPIGEKYNFVRGTFTDAARNYQESEFEPRGNSSYESDDGARLTKTIELATCTDQWQAQRCAIHILRRSRMKKTLSARFDLAAFKVRPFNVGTMTFADLGWSAQRVVCTSWQFIGDGSIQMTLQEDNATIWADPTVDQYTTPGSAGSGSSSTYTPDPPSSLTATSLSGGIELKWTLPPSMLPGDVVELWEHTSTTKPSPFETTATKLWSGAASGVVIGKADTTTRGYWVQMRAANGTPSSTEPSTTGIGGSAGAGGGVPGLSISLSRSNFSIQCDSSGVPLSGAFDNALGQVTVYSGSTDVTASCTFSSSPTNVSGSVNTATNTPVTGAKGSYRITNLTAETGALAITVTYSGQSTVHVFSVQKVRSGAAASSKVTTTFSDVSVTSYPTTGQAGPLELPVGPNGTITVSASGTYQCTTAADTTVTAKIQYREKGTGTWFDFSPSTEVTGDPYINSTMTLGHFTITPKSATGPGSLKLYEFQLVMKATNLNAHFDAGTFSVSWAP